MGDASNSRASKGNGILGGLLRRVTGGRKESKEETTRTGVSLKDRFSALRGAAPTDPVPHQQRTLDDIHGPDEADVKVIHTSAARSMRFSDRVGMEPCADTFERRISFDENDDDHECGDAHKSACDRERTPVGRYASNKISFEDDVPCTTEKKDGIGSRYGSAEKRAADLPADAAVGADEHPVTEEPARRMTLAERLKARQADKAKCPDAGTEYHDRTSDTVTEVVADVCEKETENKVVTPAPEAADHTVDADITTDDKAAAVPETEETCTVAEEEHVEVPAAAEEDTIRVMPIQIIKILDPEPEAAPLPEAAPVSEPEEVVVTHSQPIQVIEILDPEPEAVPLPEAALVSEVPETCIVIPDGIIEEACAEHKKEVTECTALPFTEYLALMPAAVEPILIDDVCGRELYEPAPVAECIIPDINAVNEAILEIENDAPDETHYTDADDVETDILRLLSGVIIDGEIVPAITAHAEPQVTGSPVMEAPITEPLITEDTAFIPFATFEAIAPEEVHLENEALDDEDEEEPENSEICFSFLSEWSTTPNAEVRFVWG